MDLPLISVRSLSSSGSCYYPGAALQRYDLPTAESLRPFPLPTVGTSSL